MELKFLELLKLLHIGKGKVDRSHPHWRYAFEKLSSHPFMTHGVVFPLLDEPWNWETLSKNESITSKLVLITSDKPWNWSYLSKNSRITHELILKTRDKPWDWNALSENSIITDEFVITNLQLSWPEKRIIETFTRWRSARKISFAWKRAVSNPEYEVCKKRLLREYEEFRM